MEGKFLILCGMNASSITYTVENRIATVTLNRPERRNALDDSMIKELTELFTTINRNNHSRVVILTGAGSAFCAGMDLDYLQKFSQLGHAENLEDARNLMKLLQLINGLKKVVIALVNGPAIGGGCGLAAACDFVFVAKEKGKLGVPEVKLGFLPAVILMFLIKRMGEGRAREFVLQGGILDAIHAKEKGLATEVFDDEKLHESVYDFASKLASDTSASSISLTKELFSRLNEMDLKDVMDYAANLNALARKTDDFKKGMDSFLKKEKLQW
jgi:methylglutaconyl-CoA hydratase